MHLSLYSRRPIRNVLLSGVAAGALLCTAQASATDGCVTASDYCMDNGSAEQALETETSNPDREDYTRSRVSASINAAPVADTWTGATNTDWFTASNWASGTVPTTGIVTVSGTTTATAPVIDGQTAQADYFIIGSGNSTTLTGGSLTIQNGGQLNLTGTVGNADTFISGDNPVVTVTGQGSKLTTKPTANIVVGSTNGTGQGNGTLEILDGAEVNIGGITIGSNNAKASTLRVNGPGSSLTIGAAAGWFGIRATPNTIVEVSDGGKIAGQLGGLYNVALTATGAGSLVSLSGGNAEMLTNEQARLNVLDGAIFQLSGTNNFRFGGQATIDGTGSAFSHQGTASVQFGSGGIAGILIVSNGGAFQTVNTLQLGNFFGEVGILNIGAAPDATAVAPGGVTAGDGINVNAGSTINFNHTAPDYIFSSAVSSEAVNTGAINQISGTTILTANSSFTGVVTITGGILQFGNDTPTGSLATNNIITGTDLTHKGTLAFGRSGTYNYFKTITGTGSVMSAGSAITALTADNSYSGGTVFSRGGFAVTADSKLGDLAGGLTFDGGTLEIIGTAMNSTNRTIDWAAGGGGFAIDDAANIFTVAQTLAAGGALTKLGAGTLILTADNSYTGGTTVFEGTLRVARDSNLGDATGILTLDGGTFVNTTAMTSGRAVSVTARGGILKTDANLTLTGTFDAIDGSWHKTGAGELIFDTSSTGDLGFNGNIDAGKVTIKGALKNDFYVNDEGILAIDGMQDGDVYVQQGGTVMGSGTVNSNVKIADNGILRGASGNTLTVNHNLTLSGNSQIDLTLGAPSMVALYNVKGNVTLNGTLNITDGGGFGPGLYRLIDYLGDLTGNGLTIGSIPGNDPSRMWIDTDLAGKHVNLMSSYGVKLNVWDGGDGVWNLAADHSNDVWTDNGANIKGPYDQGSFALFRGGAGNVVINNGSGNVTAAGMQFTSNGYVLRGDAIDLDNTAQPIIRVGDGSDAGKVMNATIEAELTGSKGLNKTDYGMLILTGANRYTGGTTVTGGILQVGNGGTTGSIDGNVNLTSDVHGHGTLAFYRQDPTSFAGDISGVGNVVQKGGGIITFSGNNTYSGGLTVEQGTAKAGIADNAFGSGNVSIKGDAKLDLDGFNETVGNLIGEQSGDGDITLGSGTLTLNQNLHGDFSGSISGTGGITKNGDGDLILYGQNHYSGTTTVNKGDLVQGAVGGFSAASAFAVVNGASIRLGGFDTTLAALSNGGDIYFGGTSGAVLNVAGNYTGNGGTLHMSAVLGDDNSLTDRMNVNGDTSGTSQIAVNNRQGFGGKTSNGIEIIKVDGNSDGIFTLNGDYKTKDGKQAIMTDSAYAYTLQKGGINTPNDGNWYLVSQMIKDVPVDPDCKKTNSCPVPPDPDRFSPAAPVYESYTATLQALNKLPTLQQRVGERYLGDSNQINSGATDSKAVWGRIEGGHNRQANSSTAGDLHQEINTFIMQAGVDGQFYENENGKLIAGITGQYGNARSHIDNRTGDGSGSVNTQGWGLGATTTWYDTSGFYVDAQAQANWYDSDLGIDAVNPTLRNGNKSFGYAMSLEAGQRIAIDQSWSLTPQTQLIWSAVDFDTFTDSYGARISNRSGDSLTARLGLAAHYADSFTGSDGRLVNTSVYGIANLYQELMGDARINYAGTPMTTGSDRTWGGIGAGGSYVWADNKYALYGEGTINTSLNHFADSYAFKGTVGFRAKW